MDRRNFIKAAGLTAAAGALDLCGCASTGTLAAGRKPNIIFILADDLGYGDLGCYGQDRIETPNLDRMAAEGMLFTQHYAGSTVCAPSRCVLMTGLHTGHALVRGNALIPLRPEDVTVTERLKEAGYTTALCGKWGLGEAGSTGIPNRKGFDYFYGYLNQVHAHNYYPDYLWRNQTKVPLANIVEHPLQRGVPSLGGVSSNQLEYSHDLIAHEALRFIDRNRRGPFFLYMALTIPHANNEAGKKGMEVPEHGIYADLDWPEPQKGHAAMITRMDRDIGRVFALLQELCIDEDTLVIFTSDNGPHREGGNDPDFNHSSGPLRGIKRDLYEGGIRVPMIARWPGRILPATVTDHVSAFWDFMPTACELAGIEAPAGIDGISCVQTLLGGAQQTHEFLYWEFHERGSKQAVRMGPWKLVRFANTGKVELYNLDDDLSEKTDIAEKHPAVVQTIMHYLKTVRTPSEQWPMPEPKA